MKKPPAVSSAREPRPTNDASRFPAVWNLANGITLGRLVLSLVFFVVLYKGTRARTHVVALALFAAASLTDFLDGWVARRRNEVTPFGRVADPLVDKILICGAMILLCFIPEAERLGLTAGVATTVMVREFLVTWLRGWVEGKGIPFGASWLGKFKFVLQTAVVLVIQAHLAGVIPPVPAEGPLYWGVRSLVWLMMGVTVLSGVGYLVRGWQYFRGEFRA